MASFDEAIQAVYGSDLLAMNEVVPATSLQFGHYQCNSAMKIGKALKKNPREIAATLVKQVHSTHPSFEMEVAGAGFINIRFKPEFLSLQVEHMLHTPHFALERADKNSKVIVEFSSPNIAKELHVGHLRSTIIGESIARVFEFLGYDVIRLNHLGDWGTQFGMLIHYLKMFQKEVVEGSREADLADLMRWYKASKALFDADPEFKKLSQLEVVNLQSGDKKAHAVWKKIVDISKKSYREIYRMLDVSLTDRGESFYQPYLGMIIDKLDQKGLMTLSEGAKCVFMEEFKGRDDKLLPLMVQKSDGGYNYDTTDMAAVWYRVEHDKADRIIYVTDSGQSLHFEMIFAASKKAGFFDHHPCRLDHVPFGLVLGADGKKFKTRSGDTEKLVDLLNEAVIEAKKILEERVLGVDEGELQSMAEILGVDAVKYSDLSSHRIRDYTFSYERMLKFEGNTAPFLLYAYVRAQSIKRKVQVKEEAIFGYNCQLEHTSELELALHLRRFDETLYQFTEDLYPHRLSDYLYQLACLFNAFFRDCRVEGDPKQNSRLVLCELTSRVLKKGLELLGLKTLERM